MGELVRGQVGREDPAFEVLGEVKPSTRRGGGSPFAAFSEPEVLFVQEGGGENWGFGVRVTQRTRTTFRKKRSGKQKIGMQ